MSIAEQWYALSARIRGLTAAGRMADQLLRPGGDSLGAMVELGAHAAEILAELRVFGSSLDSSSKRVKTAIERVAARTAPMLADTAASTEMRQIHMRSALVSLAALESELSYLLRDHQADIRSRSERAFEHLQRLIVIDDDVRAKWRRAFDAGEVACEKLGAVHLLGHGIRAFKVDSAGGRTDLVYEEALPDSRVIQRSAEGLVLTEWKKLSDGGDAAKKFEEAVKQAQIYAKTVLAGTELTQYRYAVLVSKLEVKVPDDVEIGGVTYRHINIAVEPRTPSKQSQLGGAL